MGQDRHPVSVTYVLIARVGKRIRAPVDCMLRRVYSFLGSEIKSAWKFHGECPRRRFDRLSLRKVGLHEATPGLVACLTEAMCRVILPLLSPQAPEMRCSPEFMAALMENPTLVRHVAIVGHLGHGKTLLMDVLVGQSRCDSRSNGNVWNLSGSCPTVQSIQGGQDVNLCDRLNALE